MERIEDKSVKTETLPQAEPEIVKTKERKFKNGTNQSDKCNGNKCRCGGY